MYEHQLTEFKKRIAEMEVMVHKSKQQVKRVQDDKKNEIQSLETELSELRNQTT